MVAIYTPGDNTSTYITRMGNN